MAKTPFRWLHFSDIHVGVGAQKRLWPRSSTQLLDDLETAYAKTGGFDCIVFSGDLAQKGTSEEFDAFDEVLETILARLATLGGRPPVVTVPGNHDLIRPDSVSPEAIALSHFWSQPELRERVWSTDDISYRLFLERAFTNYASWRTRAIANGVHLAPVSEGLLPGDASYRIDVKGSTVGIVGLNSTWLQLGAGDYEGRLQVDTNQLLAVTGERPDEWTRQNAINLLVTHHPSAWLHADSPATWDNDINPAGRFDLHLFGHMHEPAIISTSHGGGLARRNVQAASLFGLETYGDGMQRIQGYSVNRVEATGEERSFTSWPRRLVPVAGGRMKLAPDVTQDIDEDSGSLKLDYKVERRQSQSVTPHPTPPPAPRPDRILISGRVDLSAAHHPVVEARAHVKVRRGEQAACVAAFENRHAAWLVSDWGMGRDGFIAAICGLVGIARDSVYSLDFNGYSADDSFFDDLRTRQGSTFQQICDALANVGQCILVLDDVDVASSPGNTEGDIEALLGSVCDFAPEMRVLIRTRRRPRTATLPVVELKPLDEPDVAIYARESEIGGERYARPDAVSKLYQHTDGVPSRIDASLRDLEIVSLGDLITVNPDFADTGVAQANTPGALIATVTELAASEDRSEERAYNLLLALSALPRGEQLSRLTRFLGPHPFFPAHARALLERSLIDTVALNTLEGMPGDNTQKALIVPRQVRDYIRGKLDDQTARSIDRRALEMYFGDTWNSGDIRLSPTGRRVRNPLCDGNETQNATALILRSARRALTDGDANEAEGLTRLASAFIEALVSGDHFRSAASLADDTIRLLEEFGGHDREINVLRYELARSLRMLGRTEDARAAFEQLDLPALSKFQRQSAELGLAMVLDRLGDENGSLDAARRAIALDRHSANALQAKSILAAAIADRQERIVELRKLLAAARKRESTTVANNIRITLARLESGSAGAELLKDVMLTVQSKEDFYNFARAILDYVKTLGAGQSLNENDRSRLIDAYQFLYNERLFTLFDRCHDALWREFELAGEVTNLLNLFRHSSFIWRLRGSEATEARYLAKLVGMLKDVLANGAISASRDGAYFVVRVSVVMKELEVARVIDG